MRTQARRNFAGVWTRSDASERHRVLDVPVRVIAISVLVLAEGASADTTCTLIVDADTGATLVRAGDRCDQRLTPASTFKIPLSLMGFDSGILRDANRPAWPYKEGYPAWIDLWRRTTTPQTWLRDSVVWYSQVLTGRLGADRLQRYVDSMHYGNGDVTGDPGRRNGLTAAWLSSSLRISATEQVEFLRRMIHRQLPFRTQRSTGPWRSRQVPGPCAAPGRRLTTIRNGQIPPSAQSFWVPPDSSYTFPSTVINVFK